MDIQIVEFIATTHKKTDTILEYDFQESGNLPKARSKAISSVKKKLENTIIQNGAITTHAGFFTILYQESKRKPWALIAYRPSFNFDVYTDLKQINDYLAINAPGMKI